MTPKSDKLHLGCGLVTPEGWLNVDGSWNARLAKYPIIHKPLIALTGRKGVYAGKSNIYGHDVRKPLPWKDATFGVVYASHLLEHLYVDEADRLLKECLRVLRPGGVVRMVVPDLRPLVEGYHTGVFPKWVNDFPCNPDRADRLVNGLLMRSQEAPKGSLFSRTFDAMFDFHSHKWMYDGPSLASRLVAAGFAEVANKGYLDSRIKGVGEVEQAIRVENGAGVVAEGVRP